MRRWMILGALMGAFTLLPNLAYSSADYLCSGPFTVTATADGTVIPTNGNPILMPHYGNSVAVWLKIVTAGSGTVSVVPKMWGPPAGGEADFGTTNRASANMCAALNAATTTCQVQGHVYGVSFVVNGCAGTCDIRLSVCGLSPGGGQ